MKWYIWIGFSSLLAPALMLYYLILKAYLNDYRWGITINTYGEAIPELILFSLIIVWGIIAIIISFREVK